MSSINPTEGPPLPRRSKDWFDSAKLSQHSRNKIVQTPWRRFSSTDTSKNYWKDLSRRDIASLEDCLSRNVASQVRDPILDQNLATLQWLHPRVAISDDGTIQVLLKLPSLLHPKLDELKQQVQKTAEREIQKWKSSAPPPRINVEAMPLSPVPMMARLVEDQEELLKNLGPGLASVAHAVAVYSCKGGVGKSTTAVNLAYELARRGGRVGLVDLDIYGPSLPILVRPEDVAVRSSPKGPGMVYPIQHENVALLSLGFVAQQVSDVRVSMMMCVITMLRGAFFFSRAVFQEVEKTMGPPS